MFVKNTNMFGIEPSYPARKAIELLKKEDKRKILELGGGQGRDTLFFAQEGFQIYTLDYSEEGIEEIIAKANKFGRSQFVVALQHDVRKPLPFDDDFFEGCYSHMLYCMALTTSELEFLSKEKWRVLKPQGLNIYTVRNTTDAHYQTGIHRGEDMWEIGGGFVVHFFSKDKVERLAKGYKRVNVEEFEEEELSKRLSAIALQKIRQGSSNLRVNWCGNPMSDSQLPLIISISLNKRILP
ncbi:MAG: class I SAM-dependent methyltransferase [Methanotrichaceae archaeon]|nr:class I SAM-dependent methyltransferase [Methanotrichaceae archaeon]